MEAVGAIDLLFAIKPDSEPLHQLALGALLRHSPLLQRLGVLSAGEELVGAPTWELRETGVTRGAVY